MKIINQVRALVAQLDQNWFFHIEQEFRRHPHFNKSVELIEEEIHDFFVEYNTESQIPTEQSTSRLVIIPLEKFAWNGPDPEIGLDCFEPFFASIRGKGVVRQISSLLDLVDSGNYSIQEKDAIVVKVTQAIVDEVKALKQAYYNPTYSNTLDHFVQQSRHWISERYARLKDAVDNLPGAGAELKFNLNKKELAVLLAALLRAEYIVSKGELDPEVQAFFRNHFCYRNQRNKGSLDKAVDIQHDIGEVISYKSTKYEAIKEKIKDGLIKAINDL